MKISIFNKVLFLTGALLFANSCTKELEEYNPTGLTAELAYATPAGFESLVNAAYAQARWWYGKEEGWGLSEMGTDLWQTAVDNRNTEIMFYNNLQPNQPFIESLWGKLYGAVNICNTGIKGVKNSGMTPALQQTREGELRFLRAFYYWHIVETWGGVHFQTEPTVGSQTTANRTPVQTFYAQIIEDLETAISFLPNTTTEYGRATKPAAEAFLARVHLTAGNNQKASDLSQKVISDYSFALVPKYGDLWSMSNLKNSEVIWAVNYTANLALSDLTNTLSNPVGHNRGGHNGHLMFLMTYDRNGTYGMNRDLANGRPFARYMPSRFLLDLFTETNDARYDGSFQQVWKCNKAGTAKKRVGAVEIDVTFAIGDTCICAKKYDVSDEVDLSKSYLIYDRSSMYKADGQFNNNAQYVSLKKFLDPTRPSIAEQQSARDAFVIRLAEMYLIAAEAEFNLGNAPRAAELVNVVRTRAAQPGKVAEMQVAAGDISIDFLLDERAREFAGEQLRWFDLKRTGKLAERVAAHIPEATPHVKDYHMLRPIPQRELDAVVNKTEFVQNPGYN